MDGLDTVATNLLLRVCEEAECQLEESMASFLHLTVVENISYKAHSKRFNQPKNGL